MNGRGGKDGAGNTKRYNSRGKHKVRAAGNQKRRRVEGNKMSEQLGKQREIEWQGRRSQTSRAYK